jgi:hypothetical protein
MPEFIDLSGKRIGMLTILDIGEIKKAHTYWNVQCDCGIKKQMSYSSIVRENEKGWIKSCGCNRAKMHAKRLTTHGMKGTLELSLLDGAKRRAKNKKLKLDITVFDIKIPDLCPLLNIPIYKKGGKITDNSPSLDRINPKGGYTKGNIWVISYKANAVKNNCSLNELELLVDNFKKYATRKSV